MKKSSPSPRPRFQLPPALRPAAKHRSWQLYTLVAALSLLSSFAVSWRIHEYVPRVHDEFSYLLAGQTFAHFTLTNPTPPLWRFFESYHVLMEPTMMSKYPPGQGFVLAVGYWLGQPIYGVWLSGALWAVSFTWLVRGFFGARWALLGGLLAIAQFGITHYWVQTFWGGCLAAAGGALVFGGCRRLSCSPQARDAALLGAGIVILALTRPFEGLLACVVPLGVVAAAWWRGRQRAALRRALIPGVTIVAAGLLFLGYYNYRVTGLPWRLPYLEYEHRYSGTPYFVWQTPGPEPVFQNAAFVDYYRDYMVPNSRFSNSPLKVWGGRVAETVRHFLGPLLATAALLGLALRPRGWTLIAFISLGASALAMVLCYWFTFHYQAGAAALYLFLAVAGCRKIFLQLPRRVRLFLPACLLLTLVQGFLLWRDPYIQRDIRADNVTSLRQQVIHELKDAGGRYLVFVRLEKPYPLHTSWVFNDSRFDESPVLWAWDRGPDENLLLLARYPDRRASLMRVSDQGVSFTPIGHPL